MLPILTAKTPIIGDKHAFKDHRHRTEYLAFDVMRRFLYRTWIAKKPDAVEFCHTLVCRANGESSLYPKESIDCFDQHKRSRTNVCFAMVWVRLPERVLARHADISSKFFGLLPARSELKLIGNTSSHCCIVGNGALGKRICHLVGLKPQ